MRIISFVVLALIAEIFSCTNAQEDIQSMCTENGGIQAWEAFANGEPDLTCYGDAMNRTISKAPETTAEADAQIATFCDYSVEALKKCAKSTLEEIKSCRRADQHELIDVVYNIVVSVLDFTCENRDFARDGLLVTKDQCSAFKISSIGDCAIRFILDRDLETFYDSISRDDNLFTMLIRLKLDFDSRGCSNIQKFEECSVNVLKQCEDQTFPEGLDSLFKYINNDVPCRDLTKSPKSEATSESVDRVP